MPASFVLHHHRKPRPHFDLRLEEEGVLRSWAVPRGLPDDPTNNRLAIAVPDHDLEHLTYEDADKSIADIGTWEEHDRTERRMLFTLHGRTGSRRYALIRTGEGWLLHLTKDQPSDEARTPQPTGACTKNRQARRPSSAVRRRGRR